MNKVWSFKSRIGTFCIIENRGRYDIVYNNEGLGNYSQPWQASDDLSRGAVFSFVTQGGEVVTDTSDLDIPSDLNEWQVSFM